MFANDIEGSFGAEHRLPRAIRLDQSIGEEEHEIVVFEFKGGVSENSISGKMASGKLVLSNCIRILPDASSTYPGGCPALTQDSVRD